MASSFSINTVDSVVSRPRKMSMHLVSVILVLLSLFSHGESEPMTKPLNCMKLECPSYKVLDSQKDFEIRSYDAATWMSTRSITAMTFTKAMEEAFGSLFAYIEGANKQSAKIEMTAPVLVDVFPSTGPFCKSSFVMKFYVPVKFQSSPPLSDKLQVVKWTPSVLFAVRRFGGFMDDKNIPTEAVKLRNSLKGTSWERNLSEKNSSSASYCVAGFNSPFELENRVNEIMMML